MADRQGNGKERRLTLRAYAYWRETAGERPMPALGDFDAAGLAPFRDSSFLVGFAEEDYLQPVYCFVGAAIQATAGEIAKDSPVRGTAPGSVLDRIADHYLEAVAHKSPVGFDAEFERDDGGEVLYRGLLLPLSEDGETVDLLMGVLSWKEVYGKSGEAEPPTAEESSGTTFEPQAGDPAPAPDEGLQAALAASRTAAEEVKLHEGRAHRALYRALAETFAFFGKAQDEPQAYRAMLRQAGLRIQRRSPLTPAIKLVFGASYDKARVTEYAAALAYLRRQAVPPEQAESVIAEFEGGVKGLVAAERAARREERGAGQTDRSGRARRQLAKSPSLEMEDEAIVAPGDSEFVLLLARRRSDRLVEPVQVVPETERGLDRLLRRAARQSEGTNPSPGPGGSKTR